jgi:regulator of sigma E protease
VSFFAAIAGLALLVLIHEAGHFFAARAVGMKPRKFYIGFPPPLVKTVRNGIEYGIGMIPLGGYVKIPGMSRPEPGAFGAMLGAAAAKKHAAELARFDRAITDEDEVAARATLEELRPALAGTRGWQEMDMALAPDAYWRQKTWRRLVAIGAGPGVNLVFALVLFAAVLMVATEQTTNVIATTQPGSPARAAGLMAKDKIVELDGHAVTPSQLPKEIRATHGQAFRVVVVRHGKRIALGPLQARLDHGAYRIGIVIEGRTGPGESPPQAFVDGAKATWFAVRDTVTGFGNTLSGQNTKNISSSVGIVRAEAAAWRQGLRTFFAILGYISLALGVLNLIPILPLDGGHIAIALVEKVRGRTFAQSVYVRYSLVGIGLFVILMYFGLRNDLFGSGG